jgi:hypothetical protein
MAALARPRPLFPTRFYLGNRSLRCSTSCIPAVVLHLTAMDGGNAKGLSGTILAMESCVARRLHVSATAPALLSVAAPGATLPPPSLQSYLPTSDRQGWRKCKRIVGTILALSVACARGISASMHVRTIVADCPIWPIAGSGHRQPRR